ncbi:hypothetical protein EDB85DRAFT_1898280 [Lactarius pseudohatsudake]|nr:hypothetical protein EDB85DRAFT_1898280 [Lactarius pseudohatsudake]
MNSNTPSIPASQSDLFPKYSPPTTLGIAVDAQVTTVWQTPGIIDPHAVPRRGGVKQNSRMEGTSQIRVRNAQTSVDLADEVKGMYRVLDLINESGSNGYVDKVVIAQEPLRRFINAMSPGAYASITKVDFKTLDQLSIKPIGIYGCKDEIPSGSQRKLTSGLYIVIATDADPTNERHYIIYWPEDSTWNDSAPPPVCRNRVTFMRYLTKMCDQVVALLSADHSASIVWNDEDGDTNSVDIDAGDSERLFTFEVAKTNEQEESAVSRPGFQMNSSIIFPYEPPPDCPVDPSLFAPRLLPGETCARTSNSRLCPPSRRKTHSFCQKDLAVMRVRCRIWSDVALRDLFPRQCEEWHDIKQYIHEIFMQERKEKKSAIARDIANTENSLRHALREEVVDHVIGSFPSLDRDGLFSHEQAHSTGFVVENPVKLSDIRALYPEFEGTFEKCVKDAKFGDIPRKGQDFKALKLGVISLLHPLDQNKNLRSETRSALFKALVIDHDFQHASKILSKSSYAISRWFRSLWADPKESFQIKMKKTAAKVPDSQFLQQIETQCTNDEGFRNVVQIAKTLAQTELLSSIDAVVQKMTDAVLEMQQVNCGRSVRLKVENEERGVLNNALVEFIREINKQSVARQHSTIYLDHIGVEEERNHLPGFYRLLANEKFLLVLADRESFFVILEPLQALDSAIRLSKCIKSLNRKKLGQSVLFSFDETKRILVLQLHILVFDETHKTLQSQGSVDLIPWYSQAEISVLHMASICGREEVALVDSNSRVRIFSFVTLQFRPASIQLQTPPNAIYSSPDGSCLFVLHIRDSGPSLTAYHLETFGSTEGIALDVPDFPLEGAVLTSMVSRGQVFFLGLDINAQAVKSVAINITKKATEFMFKEKGSKHGPNTRLSTQHNCLLDCHAEVWTRFPVLPAVKRRTITSLSERRPKTLTFIADNHTQPFASYFSDLIQTFEKAMRKPTGNELSGIKVSAAQFRPFWDKVLSRLDWEVSRYRVGEWLVDLLCLIPIHIAVCRDNRFVPLANGVLSAELERSLLGAEVNQIVDKLSFGWYESIFQSYLALKPVKVVSSMGQQSVGKSYSLNHLVDTSFAGSAMRTTEGVWMSVTPTDEALIVALDFEGVDSIERSPQEDTLLVLFNTAISNLVLFRNNFAFGRDISGLFQSFQSSASVLDPAANPTLFQSTLVIIIKDVLEPDTVEISREFSLKFQQIVQQEQDANFISRLHGGKLDIIPFPVIKSREFYKLFATLKRRLDLQKISHPAAGEFLYTIKTLMAKLKIPWPSIVPSHSPAFLSIALATGYSEIEPELEPLKNFDSDLKVESDDTGACFAISDRKLPSPEEIEMCLSALRESQSPGTPRQFKSDSEWVGELASHLSGLIDLRINHVQLWLDSNLGRFQGGHAAIEDLRRRFDSLVIEMKANVQLCKSVTRRRPRLSNLSQVCAYLRILQGFYKVLRPSCRSSWETCLRRLVSRVPSEIHNYLAGRHSPVRKVVVFLERRIRVWSDRLRLPVDMRRSSTPRYTQGHTQQEHETSHGSMTETRWAVDGPDDASLELGGHKFSSNDEGAPMMCNLVCSSMGRHIHIDYCRADANDGPCDAAEAQHINDRIVPEPDKPKDAVTHSLYWQRTDPYSRDEQAIFGKCDALCSGPEHVATETAPGQPSYCTLPMFHPPQSANDPADGVGYVSHDGHKFSCENPGVVQQAFHVSSSMESDDRLPLADAPATDRIVQQAGNRLGAVYSALYSFWSARHVAATSGQETTGARRDAYSVIMFNSATENVVVNDLTSSPDELLDIVLNTRASGGTNFATALRAGQAVMVDNWSTERWRMLSTGYGDPRSLSLRNPASVVSFGAEWDSTIFTR